MANRTNDGINWTLWGGLALLVLLAVIALPLIGELGQDGDTVPGEDEAADEAQEPTITGNGTTNDTTNESVAGNNTTTQNTTGGGQGADTAGTGPY